jgi:8-oxo-dGTP pyrophosphatase MutT (NUDIX family)
MPVINIACLKEMISSTNLPKTPPDALYQTACVFLLLFNKNETLHILAIQKSDTDGYPWRNQVALPGGHMDKTDASPLDAAYRELEEELTINQDQVELIGSMGHFQTIHSKDIEVFIGFWNGKGPMQHDPNEIARILEIPLKTLVDIHHRNNYHGKPSDTYDLQYMLSDINIWGVTARILHFFLELFYPLKDAEGMTA